MVHCKNIYFIKVRVRVYYRELSVSASSGCMKGGLTVSMNFSYKSAWFGTLRNRFSRGNDNKVHFTSAF